MNASELAILLAEGEGTMLEFKESLSASFARELVALANTVGGKILLGVRDDRTIAGIQDSNELRARIQDIARNCDPPVKVLVARVGEVTVVTVRESDAKPIQCSDGFFWRQGSATQKGPVTRQAPDKHPASRGRAGTGAQAGQPQPTAASGRIPGPRALRRGLPEPAARVRMAEVDPPRQAQEPEATLPDHRARVLFQRVPRASSGFESSASSPSRLANRRIIC